MQSFVYMVFMFHILGVCDDNEDCSIVVVVVILGELEWQLVKDLV